MKKQSGEYKVYANNTVLEILPTHNDIIIYMLAKKGRLVMCFVRYKQPRASFATI